jgi:Domain of unknown function (DUF4377)
MKLFAILVLLMDLLPACRQEAPEAAPQEITMRVNHYRQRCQGESAFDCLLVQEGKQIGTQNWELFYDPIQGFSYEPGYIYLLQLRIEMIPDPPMDSGDRRYSLVKILSKKKAR